MKRSLIGAVAGFLAIASAEAAEPLKVGVSAGPYGEILAVAAGIAAKEGLEIKIIEFSDYNTPDAALAQGDLDANNFQHLPFLQNQIAKRGYDLVAGGWRPWRSRHPLRLSALPA